MANKFARALLLFLAAFLCGAAPSPQPVLVGTVSRIVDGDTLVVQLSTGPLKVRLYGIDAPEHNQPGGPEATSTLRSLVAGKEVHLEPVNQDRYSRMVAKVFLGRLNVNAEMVARGQAWVYRGYLKKSDRHWCGLEAAARASRVGLWRARDAIPPWAFRHHAADVSIPRCP